MNSVVGYVIFESNKRFFSEMRFWYVAFNRRRRICPSFLSNNAKLPQGDVKYLEKKLTPRKPIFAKRKQLGITLIKIRWLLGRKSMFSAGNKILSYTKQYSNNSGFMEYKYVVRIPRPK
jgi:hypothetical protein